MMKKDVIVFAGKKELIRRFEKIMRRTFNIQFPDSEKRMNGNFVEVQYSVNHVKTFYFDSIEALGNIVEYTIEMEMNHNKRASQCYMYTIREGL